MTARDVAGNRTLHCSLPGIFTIFGRVVSHPLLNYDEKLEKGGMGRNPLEKTQKIHWRRCGKITEFCPLSWPNVC